MRFEIPISPPQQRILALLLAAAPLLVVGGLFASFMWSQIARHAQVALLVRELTREQALIRESPDLAMRLTTIKKANLWQDLFFA
jgi:hypothetical protein